MRPSPCPDNSAAATTDPTLVHQRIKLDRWGVRRDDGATSGGSPGGGRVDPLRLSWVPAGVPVRAGALRAASACFSCGTRVRLTGAQALLPYLVLSTRLARARPPPPPSCLCRSTGWSRTADRPALPAVPPWCPSDTRHRPVPSVAAPVSQTAAPSQSAAPWHSAPTRRGCIAATAAGRGMGRGMVTD